MNADALAKIRDLYNRCNPQLTVLEIAAVIGCKRSTVERELDKMFANGTLVSRKKTDKLRTAERLIEIVRLAALGLTPKQISYEIGITQNAVYHLMERYGTHKWEPDESLIQQISENGLTT